MYNFQIKVTGNKTVQKKGHNTLISQICLNSKSNVFPVTIPQFCLFLQIFNGVFQSSLLLEGHVD